MSVVWASPSVYLVVTVLEDFRNLLHFAPATVASLLLLRSSDSPASGPWHMLLSYHTLLFPWLTSARLSCFSLHDPLARAPSMSPSSLQIQTKRGLMLFPFIALSFPPCHVICVHGMEDLFASSVSATVLFVMNTGNICFAHHYIFSLLVLKLHSCLSCILGT